MKKTKKTVIIVGYYCNNQCLFCMNSEKRNLPIENAEEIKNEMVLARKRGNSFLELIGGEMTMKHFRAFSASYKNLQMIL